VRDFTQGSIVGHLLGTAASVAIGMLAQIAFQLVDLYFVAEVGVAAIAGVIVAGNVILVMAALAQVLSIGTVSLVAHAFGRSDRSDACLIVNQSLVLSAICGLSAMALIILLVRLYMKTMAANEEIAAAGSEFIMWVLPGYVITLPMIVLSAALRGAGIIPQTIFFQILTVVINVFLAPILTAGWGTGMPLGVKGAGLATSISVAIGFSLFMIYCRCKQQWLTLNWRLMRPSARQWQRILTIGIPAGFDFGLFFIYGASVHYVIRDFGAAAQAGFGIGSQVMQLVALPGLAVALAAGPIAGQNFGANDSGRVRKTFGKAVLIGGMAMVVAIAISQCCSRELVAVFSADASAIAAASLFLQLSSWALPAQVLVTSCSGIFQGMGNTMPSMISSAARLVTFIGPVAWIYTIAEFRVEHVWYLSVASLYIQAIVSLWFLRSELKRRLLPSCSGLRVETEYV
jgi:putative MATE family efflux protein